MKSVNSEQYRLDKINYSREDAANGFSCLSSSLGTGPCPSSSSCFSCNKTSSSSSPSSGLSSCKTTCNIETASSSAAQNPINNQQSARNSKTKKTNKYHVTKVQEKVELTQKYRIIGARDPNTGIRYSLDEIVEFGLIDPNTSNYYLPSTGQLFLLDNAIELGLVNAHLIDEFIETTNESFEYIQHNVHQSSDDKLHAVNLSSNNASSSKVEKKAVYITSYVLLYLFLKFYLDFNSNFAILNF
jgi:hypothetical protein